VAKLMLSPCQLLPYGVGFTLWGLRGRGPGVGGCGGECGPGNSNRSIILNLWTCGPCGGVGARVYASIRRVEFN
jgi:hypothetical protein